MLVFRKVNRAIRKQNEDEVKRKSCNTRRSELVPLECGCHTSGDPMRAPHACTLGAEDLSMYINICIHADCKAREERICKTRMNKHTHTYMPTSLYT